MAINEKQCELNWIFLTLNSLWERHITASHVTYSILINQLTAREIKYLIKLCTRDET